MSQWMLAVLLPATLLAANGAWAQSGPGYDITFGSQADGDWRDLGHSAEPEPLQLQGLARRLEQTESELSSLRASQAAYQEPAIADPAIETVDEMTGSFDGGGGMGGGIGGGAASPLRRRWNQIQDPSITTVDQQTRQPRGEPKENWFDRLSIRGYAQFRFNEVYWEAPGSAPPQRAGDSSVGDDQSFLIRRARIILSGDVSDHMYVYIQPDFATNTSSSADTNHFGQLRDCYADLYFDEEKIHRLRVGQSKLPYGWENMQSSSNRIPLDRSDALDSAGRNQRDLGVIYYYTPDYAQDLFKWVLDEGLKGSGNYGLFGIGVYNGQGGSYKEKNDNVHLVARLALPFQFESGQVMELDIQGYTGKYVVGSAPIDPLGVPPAVTPSIRNDGYLDQRVAGSLIYYPQPLGFQTEWNVGRGPALNETQTAVIDSSLTGGYAMMMYRYESDTCGVMFPFVRYHYYKGGYKFFANAPETFVSEWEYGMEWQLNPQMELTMQYAFTDRTNTSAFATGESYRQFVGNLFRVQFQMNY